MSAWFSRLTQSADDSPGAYAGQARWELEAGDRISPPRKASAGKRIRRFALLILLAAGGGWSCFGDQTILPEWLRIDVASLASTAYTAIEQRMRAPAQDAAPDRPAIEPVANTALAPKSDSAEAPAPALPPAQLPGDAPAGSTPGTITTASLPAPAAPAGPAEPRASQAYAPPTAPAANRYQKRAETAGLHPDLSRVLLERLSEADFRNAGIAIKTALAETPESGVLVWPRQRQPGLALFEVRFVPGAATDCRRYVVSVLKDGWSTTAMPMEKCGVQRREREAAKKG